MDLILLKDKDGNSVCPKCKSPQTPVPKFCANCGTQLQGLKGSKIFLKFFAMILIPIGISYALNSRSRTPGASIPDKIKSQEEDITVLPHTSYWGVSQPRLTGKLWFRVEAREIDLGMNVAPIGDDGVTQKIDELIRDSQLDVDAGSAREMTLPVEAGKKYAYFVVNESDKPAKSHIVLSWKK